MKSIKPEVIRVRDRVLPVCSHGECMENRVWDFDTCWDHLTQVEQQRLRERVSAALRSDEDLSKVVLTGANLQEFDFTGANLSGAFLNNCNLSKCKFVDSNLRRTFLGWADLSEANMSRAELHGTVFTHANLEGVTLLAYSISFGRVPINITMNNFGGNRFGRRPHINEVRPGLAEETYRALKAYFSAEGKYDSASWASYCERVMQRKALWQQKSYFRWFTSWIFGAVSGYGEKPRRAFLSSIAVVLLYAIIYLFFDLIVQTEASRPVTFWDIIAFSTATFCGTSFPDLIPKPTAFTRILVASEAFAGIFALGIFIFTLTKRFVAR